MKHCNLNFCIIILCMLIFSCSESDSDSEVQSSIVEQLYQGKFELSKNIFKNSDFKFFYFSDVHESQSNLNRIIQLANIWGVDNVNTIINGGDTNNSSHNSYDWFEYEISQSKIDVLSCIGNHDAWIENWDWIDKKEIYENYISLVPKYFSIQQPFNAAEKGLLYYYKDYNNIRIIVIDGMSVSGKHYYWDAEECLWFQTVLEDARKNNLAVICVAHAPFAADDATLDSNITFNNIFGYRNNYKDDNISIINDGLQIKEESLICVDKFIKDGGRFICWLSGHNHYDNVIYSIKHSEQLMVVIGTANYDRSSLDSYYRTENESSIFYDRFNYIGVDLDLNILKIIRIGKNLDIESRPCNVLCLDLSTHKVLSNY